MHRNTILIVGLLAVFSALVVGVNIGKKFNPETKSAITVKNTPTETTISPTVKPTPADLLFNDPICGISFAYPRTLTQVENPSGGIMFIDVNNPLNAILYSCIKSIPKPNLTDENIQDLNIGTVSAKIYRDNNPTNDKPINKLIFRHPTKNLDIQISGLGNGFDTATASVSIQ